MENGDAELKEIIDKAEEDAVWLERSLPHVADEMRMMAKMIKCYDKNQKNFIKYCVENQRRIKVWDKTLALMKTYLNHDQLLFVKQYVKDLRKEVEQNDTE